MSDAALIGKTVLIGVTHTDAAGDVVSQTEIYGRIVAIDDRKISVEKADGGGRFGLPPAVGHLHRAAPGEYRLRSTGEVVADPDYLTSWTVASFAGTEVEDGEPGAADD